MQSQQKKVKWSRGETANALEERTDTGITNVSVALMENCTADIYGNISRRPALSLMPIEYASQSTAPGFLYHKNSRTFPFYITEDDYILINFNQEYGVRAMRIKNGGIVRTVTNNSGTRGRFTIGNARTIKFTQYNNYAIVANEINIAKIWIELNQNGIDFELHMDWWPYSGGWYAPNGTQTKVVTANEITGLNINTDGLGFTGYTYNEGNGISTVFSQIDSGVSFANINQLETQIPKGSIIQFPNIGAHMRVETFDAIGPVNSILYNETFTGLLRNTETVPGTGMYLRVQVTSIPDMKICQKYINGPLIESKIYPGRPLILAKTSAGWQAQEGKADWTSYDTSNLRVSIIGPLLTPAANEQAKDTVINVEYGYVPLAPDNTTADFPHPSVVAFVDQRLWAGGWKIANAKDAYTLVVGSQIGRYNDLKNDYNTGAEAITLDLSTLFREEVLHLVDYNGLKIFTDSSEWTYQNGGAFKQSDNGSLKTCQPIVFGSICLYADQTGSQIRAMQYELQSDIFNSSIINQMTPADLVWQPLAMAQYEDKTNNTGRHLFVLNTATSTNPLIATSNFVPGNQATIWSRWTFPTLENGDPLIQDIVDTKRGPIFMVAVSYVRINIGGLITIPVVLPVLMPATLNFNNRSDLGGNCKDNMYVIAEYVEEWKNSQPSVVWRYLLPNATVAVYEGNEDKYTYTTTTGDKGVLAQIPAAENAGVGLPINATIASHPVDVGGKTKTVNKRIAKAVMSVRNTEPGAVTINNKTGYMNPAKDMINFYGVTGMKREIIYTITNNKGAKFTIESLTMNIEYGTLIS